MSDNKTSRLRILSHFIVGYMLLALVWWAILLITKNEEAFYARAELLQIERLQTNDDASWNESMLELEQARERQMYMIIGEGAVFAIALFFGIWFINRGYANEIDVINQKRNFLLAITHELKSPLSSIRLILETFKKRSLPADDRKNLSNHGLREAERLSNLVNNLLLSARLNKSYEPIMDKIEIGSLITSVVQDIKNSQPKIDIDVNLPEEKIWGTVDRTGIYSTLYNLIENSVKYGNEENKVEISLESKGDSYLISVADQGIGIAASDKSRVFNQFYRAGQEDTRTTKGTGIGLYIVDQMIKLHQGQIEIKDNTPRGTNMLITLPKNIPDETATS